MRTTLLRDAIQAAIYGGAAFALVASPSVHAQEKGEKAEKLETIEVVGSRIKRTDVETSQPVFVIERQDLQRTGLTSIGDILQHLSTNGAALNTTFNNGGNGETQVSLRDLGPNRTLILVNGRRWVTNLFGAVDLNTIPVSIIERVEVLKDGASSIYGSDAISGVINITTRSNYDGAEATAFVGENEHGDGRVESYDFTIGANSEKANVVMNASYVKQEPIFAGDRDISATPLANISGNNVNAGASSTTPFGRFGRTGIPGTVVFDPATNSYIPFDANVNGFNFAPDNYLSTPQERESLFVQGRYQITDNVTFKTELLYNQRRSAVELAANPIVLGSVGSGVGTFTIPANALFNPFGRTVTRAQFRPNGFPRHFAEDVDTYRFGGGFEGQFELLDRNWSWDLNYVYSDNERNSSQRGLFNLNRLNAGLGPSFRDAQGVARCGVPGAVIAGCVPIDIFHGPNAFTQEMFNFTSFEAHDSRDKELWNYTANLTGDLFELPAGPLGFAAGYEYRREQGFDSPDALTATGASTGNIRQATRGGYSLDEFYAEFNVPLLKDMQFAELLELSLAVRYSDYSNFGNTTNPKAGFRWKPISDLLVRGNWSKGFRAPSVAELFLGQSDSFPTFLDPCSASAIGGISAAAQARCLSGFGGVSAVPAGYQQANSQIRITVGGNSNLLPERSTTKTLGVVYSPSWAQGLDLYLDWYNIKLTGAIGARGGAFIANDCYLAANVNSCALITRGATGEITGLFATTQNLPGGFETEGYDFTATYKIDTQWGKFYWNWDSTYTAYFGEVNKPHRLDPLSDGTLAGGNIVGNYLVFDPKWRIKSNLTTNWSYGDWGATLGARYVSSLKEPCGAVVAVSDNLGDPSIANLCSDPNKITDLDGDGIGDPNPQNKLGSRWYFDLQVTWDAPWNGKIGVGVNNLFDKDPPTAYSAFANSFDPQYPIPGRFWYVQYTQKF